MLKNFWYALAFGNEVTTKPMRVTALGQDLVIYRTADGTPAVLSDLCVHRGGALSDGWVDGNCVVCPYHGWSYETDGACSTIPANKAGTPIPKKARVDAYPTVERYGFIWGFLGDLPESERPPIPHLAKAEDPAFRGVTGTWHWKANYERVVENGFDVAHTPWVHGSAFGNRDEPEIDDYEVEILEHNGIQYGALATAYLNPTPSKGIWKYVYRGQKERVRARTAFYLPNMNMIEITLPMGQLVIYDTNIPINEGETLTKWVAYRNFFTGSWADANARKRVYNIFEQDGDIVEAIRPELLPFDLAAELHVKSDATALHYRKMTQRYRDMGWSIDTHRIPANTPRREATVIPSPARREVPELARAWVMKEVPVMAPRTGDATTNNGADSSTDDEQVINVSSE